MSDTGGSYLDRNRACEPRDQHVPGLTTRRVQGNGRAPARRFELVVLVAIVRISARVGNRSRLKFPEDCRTAGASACATYAGPSRASCSLILAEDVLAAARVGDADSLLLGRTSLMAKGPLMRLVVIAFGLVLPAACGRTDVGGEAAAMTTPTSSTTSTTTTIVAEATCRRQTLPSTDAGGGSSSDETICTWGPGLRAHVDSRGFVNGAQNHAIDLAMAERCWAAGGRVYLRSPAVRGWGCIGSA